MTGWCGEKIFKFALIKHYWKGAFKEQCNGIGGVWKHRGQQLQLVVLKAMD